jgi:hypothetical protein
MSTKTSCIVGCAARATEEEIDFLLGDGERGERVELNAMPSDVFVEFLEGKPAEHGIRRSAVFPERRFNVDLSRSRRSTGSEHVLAVDLVQ